MLSGRSIFQLPPACAEAPPDAPELLLELPDVLERSAVALAPAPEVLDRSAVALAPAPDGWPDCWLARSSSLLVPAPEVLERSVLELAPAPEVLLPAPEVELASLRGEELPKPPLAPPDAPLPDSRISETVTSGAPWAAGKVTIATPMPRCTEEAPLAPPDAPPEVEELPLRPPLVLLPEVERSALELPDVPDAPDVEL